MIEDQGMEEDLLNIHSQFYDLIEERCRQNPIFLKRTCRGRGVVRRGRYRRRASCLPRFLSVHLSRRTLLEAVKETQSKNAKLKTPNPTLLICCSLYEVLPAEGKDQEARFQFASIAKPLYISHSSEEDNIGKTDNPVLVTFPLDISVWAKQQPLRGRCCVVVHGFLAQSGHKDKCPLGLLATKELLSELKPTVAKAAKEEAYLQQCPLAQARELRSSRHAELRKALHHPLLHAILPLELYWKQHPQPPSLKDQSLRKCWVILNKENMTCAKLNGHIKQTKAQTMQIPWASYSGEYAIELTTICSNLRENGYEEGKKKKSSMSTYQDFLKIKIIWGLKKPQQQKQAENHSNLDIEESPEKEELEYRFFLKSLGEGKWKKTQFSNYMKEKRCPWCKFVASNNEDLLRHLRIFHSLLRYDPSMDEAGNMRINVYSQGRIQNRRECFTQFYRSKRMISKKEHHHKSDQLMKSKCSEKRQNDADRYLPSSENKPKPSALKPNKSSMKSQDGKSLVGRKRFKLTSKETEAISQVEKEGQQPARQYYHARTCIPVRPEELDHDSDDDTDDSWILTLSEKLLDEFEDVSDEEKNFMKLWNRHIHSQIVYADSYVPYTCEMFAKRFAAVIVQKKMRKSFLLHLINLWDFSLLSSKHILNCIKFVDSVAKQMIDNDINV